MADICDNKLIIQGDEKSMNELYNFIGLDIERNFSMEKLMPIPKEIEDFESTESLSQLSTNKINSGNRKTIEEVGTENNFTDNDYEKHLKYLEKKYGFDNSEDWCTNNWGCDSDINFLSILHTKTKILANYPTRWSPSVGFIRFLGNKFPKLDFNLEYCCPENQYAGTYKIHNGNEEWDEPSFYTLYFRELKEKNLIGDPLYRFDAPESERFDYCDTYYMDVIGGNWITAFSKSKLDKKNVVNWNEVVSFINTKY
jgi:hypothetical protein